MDEINNTLSGFVLIDKDSGMSSSFVDGRVKRKLSVRKAGHLGTLDPFATGLLVVAVGEATKALTLLPDDIKSYEAVLKLGEEKDTMDLTGNTVSEAEVPDIDEEKIIEVLLSFLGDSKQTPPSFSAVHLNGVRAYYLARNGEEFSLPQRNVHIEEIDLISYDRETKEITFTCTVSKGTYVRVLASDIAKKLGTVGYLSSLRRTRVSDMYVKDAKKLDLLTPEDIIPIEKLTGIEVVQVSGRYVTRARNGNTLDIDSDSEFILVKQGNIELAIYRKEEKFFKCYRGFAH